jgi:enoyl-CoA hydratase/carnithine racemase
MQALPAEENAALTTEREEWLWRWYTCPLPTVAAVPGIAYGAGTSAADLFAGLKADPAGGGSPARDQ